MNYLNQFKEVKIVSSVFWYLFTMIIVIIIGAIINPDFLSNNNLLSLISTILFIFVLLYKFRVNINNLSLLIKDYLKKFNFKELFNVIATQLCLSIGISSLLISLVYFFFPNILSSLLTESAISETTTYNDLLIAFLSTVVCAPIMEELFFRAIIFKRIYKKFNIYIAMIISSLIFGILHIDLAIISAFIFGIACCILYVKHKNILITISVHFFNNFIAFLPKLDFNNTSNSNTLTYNDALLFLSIGFIFFFIGMVFFIKFIIKNKIYIRDNLHFYSN